MGTIGAILKQFKEGAGYNCRTGHRLSFLPSQGQLIAVPSIACLRRETNIIFCHLHFAPQAVPRDVVVAQHG